jgi:hypothetical protein
VVEQVSYKLKLVKLLTHCNSPSFPSDALLIVQQVNINGAIILVSGANSEAGSRNQRRGEETGLLSCSAREPN